MAYIVYTYVQHIFCLFDNITNKDHHNAQNPDIYKLRFKKKTLKKLVKVIPFSCKNIINMTERIFHILKKVAYMLYVMLFITY